MLWYGLGSAFMLLAVALGAFGAHGLRGRLSPEMLAVFETGVRYHVYHGLALFAVAWLSERHPGALAQAAGFSFALGILVFSGSLYLLSVTGTRWLGAVTPVGGLALLVGWLLLLVASWRG
jgi:uncharacterized membrane protein YgdD (TMEM256/DUF423 family)